MIDRIISTLEKQGFSVVDFSRNNAKIQILDCIKGKNHTFNIKLKVKTFDIIAKNSTENTCVVLKFLENIDNFPKNKALELRSIANLLNATPLIIGVSNRNGKLEDNVLYNRYGIYTINYNTFYNIFKFKKRPRISSNRGGYFVSLDPQKLRKLRRERNLSLNDVAKHVGVTSKSIHEYENKKMKTRLNHISKLAQLFNYEMNVFIEQFTETLDIFSQTFKQNINAFKKLNEFQQEINNRLLELGFITHWFNKAPFDMYFEDDMYDEDESIEESPNRSKKRDMFISELSAIKESTNYDVRKMIELKEKQLAQQIEFLRKIKEVLRFKGDMVMLLDNKIFENKKHVQGIPVIHKDEMPSKDPEELKRIIFKRKRI
ncbi:MAG: helix-turn-helix domain-containing protein [Promethearchaeota archaeon]